MKTRHTALLQPMCATATGCAQRLQPLPDQQLNGKNADDRGKILARAYQLKSKRPRATPSTTISNLRTPNAIDVNPMSIDMQSLYGKLGAFMNPVASERPGADSVAENCADLARKEKRSHKPGSDEHAAQILRICEEVRGNRISLKHETF